jgi:Ca2+-binding RTX toxin-like protein
MTGGTGNDLLFDGTVAVANPAADSLRAILAAYVPTNPAKLAALSNRLVVTFDTNAADSLTGGAGADWFWSNDALDVLDLQPKEPHNAVA